ncbi:DUF4190 domain-containing protein [Agromyces humi]|uniref:DUF4190 domain-containing protein n=1 Tax=Agromyces humi TaxID=1766800 RepID=UPI001357BB73|nr:DUF4190 domain-containing protein [Agromyces humi]
MSTIPPPPGQQPEPAASQPTDPYGAPPAGQPYGAPVAAPTFPYGAPQPVGPAPSTTNGLGIASIILGGVGLLLAFIPFVGLFGGFLAFVGLVLGIIGILQKNKSRVTAIIGTSLSGLALLLSILMAITYAAVLVNAVDEAGIDAPAVVEEGDDAAQPADETPAEPELGTRENPAPFGSTVVVDTLDGPVWEVTAGAPNLDITADVKAANQFNDDPAPGNAYASLPVTIKYVGEESGAPFDLSFTYVSPAGQSYDGSYVVMDGQLSDISELYTDASGTGTVIIEIPVEGAAAGVWGVEYILAGEPIFFGNAQ